MRGRATEEETQMGKKIEKEDGGWERVKFNRVKMRCRRCFTERAVDNYVNMMAA